MENDNAATIAEVINSHQQIPHNGGWTCAAKDCPWTYDDSPLPLTESAKHQADVIAKTLHPVAAPSVEQIESVLGEHIHPGDVSSTPVIAGAIHALYGTPGDADHAQSFHEEVMLDARRQAEERVRELEAENNRLKDAMSTNSEDAAASAAEVQRLTSALGAAQHNYANMRDGRLNETLVANQHLRAALKAAEDAIKAMRRERNRRAEWQRAYDALNEAGDEVDHYAEVAQAYCETWDAARAAVDADTEEA